jgi:hypothetical protein
MTTALFQKKIFIGFLILVASALFSLPALSETVYQTGFESADGFYIGSASGQNGWLETTNSNLCKIVSNTKFEGDQALEVGASSGVHRAFTSSQTLLYIDGRYQATASNSYPDVSLLAPSCAYFMFHTIDGVVGLNGDGTGNGSWVQSGLPVPVGFARITLAINFTTHSWSLYINETTLFNNLGFLNNTINQLNGMMVDSSETGSGYLDALSISSVPPTFLLSPTPTITASATLSPLPTSTITVIPPTLTPTATATASPLITITPSPTQPTTSIENWEQY